MQNLRSSNRQSIRACVANEFFDQGLHDQSLLMVSYEVQIWFTALISFYLPCCATGSLGFGDVDVSYYIDSRISVLRGLRGGRGADRQNMADITQRYVAVC